MSRFRPIKTSRRRSVYRRRVDPLPEPGMDPLPEPDVDPLPDPDADPLPDLNVDPFARSGRGSVWPIRIWIR